MFLMLNCAALQTDRLDTNHSLDINVKADKAVTMQVKKPADPLLVGDHNPYLGLTQLSYINRNAEDGTMWTMLFSGISVSDYTRMFKDFNYCLEMTKVRHVKLMISSPGGDAFTGLAIADLINDFQKKGLHIEAHGAGIIASAAVPVFAVCSPRYASPGTIFMVHEAALWKWPGRETSSDIRAQNELMVQLQDKYLGYLVRNTHLELDKWIEMEKKTTWFNAQKAAEFGLVDVVK